MGRSPAAAGPPAATRGGLRRAALHALEQFTHAFDHLTGFERLDEHAVAPHLFGTRLIDRLEGAGQQQHRDVLEIGPALHERRHVVAALFGHADVGEHDVGKLGGDTCDGLLAVVDGNHLDVLARKRQLDDALDGHAVVGQQELLHHSTFATAVASDLHANELHDLLHRRPRLEHAGDTERVQLRHVRVGNDPADHHAYVVEVLLAQQLDDAGADMHVRPRQNRQADDVSIFLQGRGYDLLGSLPQAGVDDFHPGIAERPGDDLRAPIVTVEPRFGDNDPNPAVHPLIFFFFFFLLISTSRLSGLPHTRPRPP